jgi:hypothetical protein
MVAQLRDVLAAEDSTPVPEKNNHGRAIVPESTKREPATLRVRQCDGCQARADGFRHVWARIVGLCGRKVKSKFVSPQIDADRRR